MDVTSIISSVLSNGELAQLGFGGVLGYVIGWGSKKLLRLLSLIVAVTLAVVGIIIAYLSAQGVITVNYGQLEVLTLNIGQWIIGTAESVLQSAQFSISSVGIMLGFMLGFKKG